MRVLILRSFTHSLDGVTEREAVAGAEDDISAVLVPGLERAGYVAQLQPVPEPQKEPIPAEEDASSDDEQGGIDAEDVAPAKSGRKPKAR